MPSQEERVKFVDYILAYFDLMGQSEKLNQLRITPTNEQEIKKFNENANLTYRAVRAIRNGLRESFDNYNRKAIEYINSTIAHPNNIPLLKMVESNYQFHFYSDCFAVTCRYSNEEEKPLIQHVYGQLVSLSFMIITCLRNDTPVRGGIEIGKAFEWTEGDNIDIYGPVMLDVDELEKRIAWYPRIVIGENLYKNINLWNKKINEGDSYFLSFKPTIESCKHMIWLDKDGRPTLDYLGPHIYSIVNSISNQIMIQNVKLGWEFVSNEYEKLKNNKDSNLAMKYFLLKEYYTSRLAIWKLD